jgi:hypothetical protein
MTMATTTKKATTKKATKKAAAKAGDNAASAVSEKKAPATASKATKPAQARDGAKGGKAATPTKAAAKVAPPADDRMVEVITDDEAVKRGGMIEIVRTLMVRNAALRLARKGGPGHFVIAHEDGRSSVAKMAEQPEASAEAAEAEQPEAPAKPKHSLETAPGKALDHAFKEGRRRIKEKAKAKAAEKPAAAKGSKAKGGGQAKPAKAPKAKKVSALDAAAQVLAKAKQPMRAKELIEQMAAAGLWTSPGGKTPEATLYAAMLREIGKKGEDSRFQKVDRGAFVATGKGA